MKPKFSIVVITKNEEKTLPKLLNSLSSFKKRDGEICILDTGSTDKTIEIAKEFGCIVNEVGNMFKLPVDDVTEINNRFVVDGEEPIVEEGDSYFNYSAARNYAAKFTSNDFIFNYDADEVSVNMDIDIINKYIIDGATQFEYNFVFAYDQWNNEAVKFIQCKAYDRTKIKWEGIIHELLIPFNNEGLQKILLNEEVYKLGHYQNHETNRHSYLIGLAVDCFTHPENDRHSHYLSREMLWNNRPKSALKEFERHVTMGGWHSEKAQSYSFIGDVYGRLNQPEKQLEAYNMCIYTDSGRREGYIKLANFYKSQNNYQATLCYSKAAMEIPYNPYYANMMSQYTYEPYELAYWACGWLGRIEEAQKYILECLNYKPYDPIYLRDTKYYFEFGAPNIDGWMRFEELQWLYNTAKTKENILEVGSWKGRSTSALLSGCKGIVTSVDTWKGSQDDRDSTKWMAKQEDVFETFKKNVGHFKNLNIHRAESTIAAKDYLDEYFDMIFIDAEHTYEGVKSDIEAWLPKVKKDGLICGHDYVLSWMNVIKAVDEKFSHPDGTCLSIWWVDLSKRKL